MENKRPKVGIGVVIRKDGNVLLGERINAHGEGMWAFPGGHLEYGESWEGCSLRETIEETGVEINNLHLGTVTNDIFEKEEKHYITLFMLADYLSGEPQVLEPHKCARWEWFKWSDLPDNLFLPFKNAIAEGFNPFS